MDSTAASRTMNQASATQKEATKARITAPLAFVTAPNAASGDASAADTAAVQSAATDSFARVSNNRSPAVRRETLPMLLSVSSNAWRAPSVNPTS
eukprot:scaffold10060_cov30-Tisochrysis_lutea.AAC.3